MIALPNRAGLLLFASYMRSSKLILIMGKLFGFMRKNKNGVPVVDMLIQLLCFFMEVPAHTLHRLMSLSKTTAMPH